MEEFFGTQVLYQNAEGGERAMADVDIQRLLSIRAELIIENWNPQLVQTKNIPFLAFSLGVTLWEPDYWTEAIQRQWLADQWEFKARRGTKRGEKMALEINGFDLVQEVTPPQGYFLNDDTGSVGTVDFLTSSFIGIDRVGFPPFTVYSLVDLNATTLGFTGFFIDASFVEVDFIDNDDLSHVERGNRAIGAAKALRDENFSDYAPLRQLTASDVLIPSMNVGDWVPKDF
jgi:phage tail P2-like protein